jgi:hypothetical protein
MDSLSSAGIYKKAVANDPENTDRGQRFQMQ